MGRNRKLSFSKNENEGSDSAYFEHMQRYRVLTAEEEISEAIKIRNSEITYWITMFSYPQIHSTIFAALRSKSENGKPLLEAPPKEIRELRNIAESVKAIDLGKRARKKWDEIVLVLAEKLRDLDITRELAESVRRAIYRLAGLYSRDIDVIGKPIKITKDFKLYLKRLQRAYLAQQLIKRNFMNANLRLVVMVARRYNKGMLSLIDLVQEGNIGLMKAVERFDHRRGFRFSTYATWWIRHAISRAFSEKGHTVRMPVYIADGHNRIEKTKNKLISQWGREPTDEELRIETGLTKTRFESIESGWCQDPYSLDYPVGGEDGEGGKTFVDLLEEETLLDPQDTLDLKDKIKEANEFLSVLTPMEASVIKWRFGIEKEDEFTLSEIGTKYKLSRERIRQIQKLAFYKMRTYLEEREKNKDSTVTGDDNE